MSAVTETINNFVPMYAAIGLGWLAGRFNYITVSGFEGLESFLVIISIPALTFGVLSKTNLYNANPLVLAVVIVQALVCLIGIFICAYIFKILKREKYLRLDWVVTWFAVLGFPNVMVVGIPIILAAYGSSVDYLLVFCVVTRHLSITPVLVTLYELVGAEKELAAKERKGDGESEPLEQQLEDVQLTGESIQVQLGQQSQQGNHTATSKLPEASPKSTKSALVAGHREGTSEAPADPSTLEVSPGSESNDVITQPHKVSEGRGRDAQSINRRKEKRAFAAKLAKAVLTRLFSNTFIYSAITGILYSLMAYKIDPTHVPPKMMSNFFNMFSACLTGIAFFNVGYTLYCSDNFFPPAGQRLLLCVSFFLRFFVSPVSMGVVAYAIGLRGVEWKVVTMQAVMPQAITPYSFARYFKVHADLLNQSITFGTVVSLPVILGLYFFLEQYPQLYE
eukprot:comp59222_c0_seq1/m.47847 comp59222_c0_seq1/g.47847  ORF comp59222_c0_seq1/g.47847 comp59222_c0_seq1/m.47847 type:complete len:450 (-) comp59222_c0_seq1:611-1960(-)